MTDLRKVAEMALEALETLDCGNTYKTHNAASALRQALEQPEHDPVAWVQPNGEIVVRTDYGGRLYYSEQNVYTEPPKREWVGLTEEEVHFLWMDMGGRPKINGYDFAKAIEAKLKEKNT